MWQVTHTSIHSHQTMSGARSKFDAKYLSADHFTEEIKFRTCSRDLSVLQRSCEEVQDLGAHSTEHEDSICCI